ncbi:unnamed protein product [Amoebophrya sp. A120]|nr:unnamed protein product [Amoebophrya sp. A120]|eukprot:GSA120T00002725001.1
MEDAEAITMALQGAIPLALRDTLENICEKYVTSAAELKQMVLELGTTDRPQVKIEDESEGTSAQSGKGSSLVDDGENEGDSAAEAKDVSDDDAANPDHGANEDNMTEESSGPGDESGSGDSEAKNTGDDVAAQSDDHGAQEDNATVEEESGSPDEESGSGSSDEQANTSEEGPAEAEAVSNFPPYPAIAARAEARLSAGVLPGATSGMAAPDSQVPPHLDFLPQSFLKETLARGNYWIDGPIGYKKYHYDGHKLCPVAAEEPAEEPEQVEKKPETGWGSSWGSLGADAKDAASSSTSEESSKASKTPGPPELCIVGGKLYNADNNWYWAQMPQRRYFRLNPDEDTAKIIAEQRTATSESDAHPHKGEHWHVSPAGAKLQEDKVLAAGEESPADAEDKPDEKNESGDGDEAGKAGTGADTDEGKDDGGVEEADAGAAAPETETDKSGDHGEAANEAGPGAQTDGTDENEGSKEADAAPEADDGFSALERKRERIQTSVFAEQADEASETAKQEEGVAAAAADGEAKMDVDPAPEGDDQSGAAVDSEKQDEGDSGDGEMHMDSDSPADGDGSSEKNPEDHDDVEDHTTDDAAAEQESKQSPHHHTPDSGRKAKNHDAEDPAARPGLTVTESANPGSKVLKKLNAQYPAVVLEEPTQQFPHRAKFFFPGKSVAGWATWTGNVHDIGDHPQTEFMVKNQFRPKNFVDYVRLARFDTVAEEKKLQQQWRGLYENLMPNKLEGLYEDEKLKKQEEMANAHKPNPEELSKKKRKITDELRHAHCLDVRYGRSETKQASLRCAAGEVVDKLLGRLRITSEIIRNPDAVIPYKEPVTIRGAEAVSTSASSATEEDPVGGTAEDVLRASEKPTKISYFTDFNLSDAMKTEGERTRVASFLNDFLFFPKDKRKSYKLQVIGPDAPLNYPSYVKKELEHPRAWDRKFHEKPATDDVTVESSSKDSDVPSFASKFNAGEGYGTPEAPMLDKPKDLDFQTRADDAMSIGVPKLVTKPLTNLHSADDASNTAAFFSVRKRPPSEKSKQHKPVLAFLFESDDAVQGRKARKEVLQPSMSDDGASRMLYLGEDAESPLVSAPCHEGEPFSCMPELRKYLGLPERRPAQNLENSLQEWWSSYMQHKRILA